MKIAILGYGQQGRSAYAHWREGNQITICDKDEALQIPDGAQDQLGSDYLKNLDRFDLLIRSPGIHPTDIANANSPAILDKVTTVTNEFFRVCPSRNIIGVTGTKGKGTTSTLIAKMLEAAGKRVHLGGNIGTPPLELLENDIRPEDWVVLELANFQLIDLEYSPPIAVCLMVVPEHLDWHGDAEEYFNAKIQLFRHQTEKDVAIYYGANETSKRIAESGKGQKIPYYAPPGATVDKDAISIGGQPICTTAELKLLGKHNWQNVCAAVTTVWQITQNVSAMRSVLTSFSGLPYRIEFRREVNGVRYYNDSFAVGTEACLAAYAAIPGKKVMIIGGLDRGLELSSLPETFKKHPEGLRKVMLVGASAQRTAAVFDAHDFKDYILCDAKDMKTMVEHATMIAHSKEGDAVVLSPAFASFDMFKNFEDRGKQFNQAVEQL